MSVKKGIKAPTFCAEGFVIRPISVRVFVEESVVFKFINEDSCFPWGFWWVICDTLAFFSNRESSSHCNQCTQLLFNQKHFRVNEVNALKVTLL